MMFRSGGLTMKFPRKEHRVPAVSWLAVLVPAVPLLVLLLAGALLSVRRTRRATGLGD